MVGGLLIVAVFAVLLALFAGFAGALHALFRRRPPSLRPKRRA
jgi:hypothetical protein